MKRIPLSILAAGVLVALNPAQAQEADKDRSEWSGSISIKGITSGVTANDESKLNEYRDLSDGVTGGFELRRRGDSDYLNAYGENLGRHDQYLDLNGGSYGSYKYRLYRDDLRHQFGAGPSARSPFVGIPGNTLTVPGNLPNGNVNTWSTFNEGINRRDYGGMFELQKTSPWYGRVEYNEVQRTGTMVLAGAQGTSPGNGFMDLPAPIDYTTRNYFAEGGYAGASSHFAVNALYSTFDNGNNTLRWQNGFFGNGMDTTVLPPSNEMWRLAANGNVRRLPMDSTFAARLTYSRLTSSATIQPTMLSTGGANPATNPSEPTFNGNKEKMSFSASFASRPTRDLDTRLLYNYFYDKNDSTKIDFNPAVGSGLLLGSTDPRVNCANVVGAVCENELFHLRKHVVGAEAGYRLTSANKLQGGLEYSHATRERVDFDHTDETRYFVEWKNTSLDALSSRIKYQRTKRRSGFNDVSEAFAANPMDLYVRRFDLANVNQNLVKLVFDSNPVAKLDLGFEAIYKVNDYPDTSLGRTWDRRQEYYASVGYGDPSSLRGMVFGDIEFVQYDATHRVGTGNPDPSTPPTTTTYNWDSIVKDKFWQVGAGLDWVPLARFKVKSSVIYAETKGTADFMVQPGGAVGPFRAIDNFHNTRLTSFNVRGIYDVSKAWELTAGYSYESWRFSDITYDNTKYVTTPVTTSSSYVTGRYSFQPYTANIVYATAKFRF